MSYEIPEVTWMKLDDCLKKQGVTYSFPEGNNNGFMYKTGDEEGPAKFHIHSIESLEGGNMVFEKLLTKSGNWRSGNEPDLANLPMSDWEGAVISMNSSTIFVVTALKNCFTILGATYSS